MDNFRCCRLNLLHDLGDLTVYNAEHRAGSCRCFFICLNGDGPAYMAAARLRFFVEEILMAKLLCRTEFFFFFLGFLAS